MKSRTVNFRFLSLFLAFVMIIGCLAGCGGGGGEDTNTPAPEGETTKPADDGTAEPAADPQNPEIVVAVASGPSTFDCMTTPATVDQRMGFHVFEQLIIFNQASELTPQLATSWENNDDYTEWTFKLKEGVTFHDGSTFGPEDVIASTERYQRLGYRTDLFSDLKSVEEVDGNSIKYTLNNPNPLFSAKIGLPGMGMFFIYPSEYCGTEYDNLEMENAIGTGPYKYSEYVIDDHITMEKFEDYVPDTGIPASGQAGERIAYFDKITWMIVPNSAQRLNGLIAGEYQYADDLDVSAWDTLNSTDGIEPVVVPNTWIPLAWFNTLKGPLADQRVREALLLCIDMDDCLLASVGGHEELYDLNPSLFFKEMVWYNEVEGMEKYNAKDLDRAKELLDEAGYNGEEIKWMCTQDYPFMYQISVVVQQCAAEVGLNIQLDVNDWGTCVDALINGSRDKDWDVFMAAASYADNADPSGLDGDLILESELVPYASQEMNDAALRGHSADVDERIAAYNDVMKIWYQDVPGVIFGTISTLSGQADNIAGEPQGVVLQMYNEYYE